MANPIVLKTLRGKTRLLLFVIIFFCINGCQSYSKPAYSGRIIDLETGAPIPNALVEVAYWKGSYGLIEQHSKKISWNKVKTNGDGFFEIPPLSTFIGVLSWDVGVTFSVQKDNYTELTMEYIGNCLSNGCSEQIFDYPGDKTKKIIISSHMIGLTKLNNHK